MLLKLIYISYLTLTLVRYCLGPNGGIVTSLNLFATRFDQVHNHEILSDLFEYQPILICSRDYYQEFLLHVVST